MLIRSIKSHHTKIRFSYGAMWTTYEQVVDMSISKQLRGKEPLIWFKYIEDNGLIHPLSIL